MARRFALKKQEPTESQILNAVGEYLSYKRYFFFRVNNAPTYQSDGSGGGFFRRQSKYSINGVPDFIMIDDTGHFIGLEIKTKKGIQSPEQKLFEAHCKSLGAEYHLIRSVDDLLSIGI